MSGKIVVSGVGCCLVDKIYSNISFNGKQFGAYYSMQRGDGGLTPGQLVFKEEFEAFAEKKFSLALEEITKGRSPDKINIGGPCIVALIHVAQMLETEGIIICFYGSGGNDEEGKYLLSALKNTPVNIDNYRLLNNDTPSTVVLSDPSYDNGHGERIFINSIGSAWDYTPEDLNDVFFSSNILVFGGTALVPKIHDNLTKLLRKAKTNGCITVVNTVFDFRNETSNPHQKWPLGKSDDSYGYIDLLLVNQEEALRLSMTTDIDKAIHFFRKNRVGALVITNGSNNIRAYSDGSFFGFLDECELPVSKAVSDQLKKDYSGDTTGCGDNFVGGVIASMSSQLQMGVDQPDLKEACIWGIVSGGFCCFYMGGAYFEEFPGEKRNKIEPYYEQYQNQ